LFAFLINAFKIIFLLGFLILIHEGGHFVFAKLFKVKVKEFSIGFGPKIWDKQGKETKYTLRLIPLGGYVNMLGEEIRSEEEGSFNKASIPKRMMILVAGGLVNIIFGLLLYFILVAGVSNIQIAFEATKDFIFILFDSIKQLFTGSVGVDQLMGPVGISDTVAATTGFADFAYMLALISVSLGITNLLPFPPLDGGKVVILLIEAIRRKPLKENIEVAIQMAGFFLLIGLSIYVAYNDVLRIF